MITLILNGSSKNTLDMYSDFVPQEFEHYMTDESALLIGIVNSGVNGLEAAGVTIVTAEDDQMNIKWMWVDPELHNLGFGSKMLDTVFKTALENGVDIVNAQIPLYDGEWDDEPDVAGYFYEFGFYPANNGEEDEIEVDGIKVLVLTTEVDAYLDMANDLANAAISERKIKKGYDKFPNRFTVTGIEYFSGVPVVI